MRNLLSTSCAVLALASLAGCTAPSAPVSGNPDASANLGAISESQSPAARASVERFHAFQRLITDRATRRPGQRTAQAPKRTLAVIPPSTAEGFERTGDALLPAIGAAAKAAAPDRGDVTYPLTAAGRLRVRDLVSAAVVDVRLRGVDAVPAEISQNYVVYPGALRLDGGRGKPPLLADVLHRPTVNGTEDYIHFERQPPQTAVTYDVTLGAKVVGLRLIENVLEFLDAGGAPRLRMTAPFLSGSDGRIVPARVDIDGCAFDTNPAGPWDRPITPIGAGQFDADGGRQCAVRISWGDKPVAYPALLDPTWQTTGSMLGVSLDLNPGREFFTLTVLKNGKALAAGGEDLYRDEEGIPGCELYDPNSGTWALTGSMNSPRGEHTANLLKDGTVLAVGGMDQYIDVNGQDITDTTVTQRGRYGKNTSLRTCDIYDPNAGTWAVGPQLVEGRASHRSVTLPSGDVLVSGGYQDFDKIYLDSAEIYSFLNKTWTATIKLAHAREGHTMDLLKSGKVIVAGGFNDVEGYLIGTEIYDVGANTWTAGANMQVADNGFPRWQATSTTLPDGTVLVVAGYSDNCNGCGNAVGTYLKSAELYDPLANTWTNVGSLTQQRYGHTATLLTCGPGNVIIAGGYSGTNYLNSVELYDPVARTFSSLPPMKHIRGYHAAALVTTMAGSVRLLEAGGGGSGDNALVNCEYLSGIGALGCACSIGSDCLSNFCADGVCCNTACTGACQSCNAAKPGTCATTAKGGVGRPSCMPYVCDGTNTGCPGTCTGDSDCSAGQICNCTGTCVAPQMNGACCSRGSQCNSTFCSDGVCCNAACSQGCDYCNVVGKVGTCTVAAKGDPGANPSCGLLTCDGMNAACPTNCNGDADCTGGQICDCTRSCVLPQQIGACCTRGSQCASTFCVDGVCCTTACGGACDACNLAGTVGTCTIVTKGQPGAPLCAPYLCGGTVATCPTTCTVDGDCAAGDICNCAGQCVPPQANGACCTRTAQCSSGFCADGVCCNTACGGSCDACNLAGTSGTCTIVAAGNSGVPSCGPYRCNGTIATCPITCAADSDCAAGSICDCNSHCVAPQILGSCCTRTSQCSSGFCANGVCCDQACNGSCAACNLLGNVGKCSPVTMGSPGLPPCAPRTCDGTHLDCNQCTLDSQCPPGSFCSCGHACVPTGTQANGQCCTANAQCQSAHCVGGLCCDQSCTDGCDACNLPGSAGTCSALPKGNVGAPLCSPYVCDGQKKSCPTSCTLDTDCAAGDVCDCSGRCVAPQALGLCCARASQCASGFCANGVCCDQACNTNCAACNVVGFVGSCHPRVKGDLGTPGCGSYVCDGVALTCPATCTADADCGQGTVCSCGGRCVAPQQNGACCTRTAQCASGFCVNGVCCNSGCTAACARCDVIGREGTCSVVSRGAPGAPTCGPYVCDGVQQTCPNSCSKDGDCVAGDVCNCLGQCVAPQILGACCTRASQCASGFCVDGVCCNAACSGGCDRCNLVNNIGTCTVVPRGDNGQNPSCQPYICDGTNANCPTQCKADGDCSGGNVCNCSGLCVPPQQNGLCCARGAQCASGFCAGGVCCNSACIGGCESCNLPTKVGSCNVVTRGDPGNPPCAPFVCDGINHICPGSCSSDGDCKVGDVCNCQGQCVLPQMNGACCTRAMQCSSGNCVNNTCCNAPCAGACNRCDLPGKEGMCLPAVKGDEGHPKCAPYVCDGTHADCPTMCPNQMPGFCDDSHTCCGMTCILPGAQGDACAADCNCKSGHCVDGFCCDTSCNGQCQACNVLGKEGKCSVVTGPPVGGRTACTGMGACVGACNGMSVACVFPDNTVNCAMAMCTNGTATPDSLCDGKGACTPSGPPVTCPNGCSGTRCAPAADMTVLADMTPPAVADLSTAPADMADGSVAGRFVGGGCGCKVGRSDGSSSTGGIVLSLVAGALALLRRRRPAR